MQNKILKRRTSRSLLHGVMVRIIAPLLLFMPVLASCNAPAPLQYVPVDLGIPSQALNSPVIGPLPDTTELHVRITFKVSQEVINKLSSQVHPHQPSHLEKLANQIGIDDATYQKIKAFFNLQGIVLNLSKLRTNLSIDAKASTFAKLFQTHFVVHKYNGRTFFTPATPPKLPRFIVDMLVAITGLDNYSTAPQHTFAVQPASNPRSAYYPAQDCYPLQDTLLPMDVAHAYGYDQLWNKGWHGENMTVNLVEIDGFYQDDIQNYLDCINFQGNLNVVSVDAQPSDAVGETALDIEMVAGLARSVNIVDYQTDGNSSGDVWSQVNDELQQILNDNTNNANAGSVVSISLGTAEGDITGSDRNAIDASLRLLTQVEHMRIFVASGDCGAFSDRIYHDLSVSFPASDPWATSVGGTVLNVDGSQHRAGEVAWSDSSDLSTCENQWGSGGGNSQVYAHPGWQEAGGINNQFSAGNHRQIPDIAAAAYALAVFFNGQWGAVGGTSAAAPIWAAGMVLVNEGLIQQIRKFTASPQLFYVVAQGWDGLHPYYDVTRGNNLYYPATPGWDYTTGLGTPNLGDFYYVLCQRLMSASF
ncbi:MAG TPA: S53 family peptidase [Ktedonobacteraceae bacterium]|nr:S53 family peptidase [Ktedonobacteraceae bacterium]